VIFAGGLIASGVGNYLKNKKESDNAKKAAAAQVKGTEQASGYTREGLGQLSQLYSPYLNSGAATMMNRLTTPGAGARYASPGAPSSMPPPGPMMGGGNPNQAMPRGGMPPPQQQMYGGMPPGMGGTFAQMGPPQGMPMPRMPPQGGPQGPPPQRYY
jgi:hypothetical protein